MRRIVLMSGAIAIATSAALTGGSLAATKQSSLLPLPPWLVRAERQTLKRMFGGARPIDTTYIPYPHKIAVVFEFDHVVVCGPCTGPYKGSPRGRVIRLGYDRQTHRRGEDIRFCESNGLFPPRARCLER
jgi:hypothetical protein